MIEILAQVTGKDARGQAFCAGIVLWDDVVVEASPIVRHYLWHGMGRKRVREACKLRKWQIEVVHELRRSHPGAVPSDSAGASAGER